MSHRGTPLCGNKDCPCGSSQGICHEYIEYHGPYCARCGWEESDHPMADQQKRGDGCDECQAMQNRGASEAEIRASHEDDGMPA